MVTMDYPDPALPLIHREDRSRSWKCFRSLGSLFRFLCDKPLIGKPVLFLVGSFHAQFELSLAGGCCPSSGKVDKRALKMVASSCVRVPG